MCCCRRGKLIVPLSNRKTFTPLITQARTYTGIYDHRRSLISFIVLLHFQHSCKIIPFPEKNHLPVTEHAHFFCHVRTTLPSCAYLLSTALPAPIWNNKNKGRSFPEPMALTQNLRDPAGGEIDSWNKVIPTLLLRMCPDSSGLQHVNGDALILS